MRHLQTALIATVLLFFFSFPISMILYGGGAGAIGGFAILGMLIIVQLPFFLVAKRMGIIPTVDRDGSENTKSTD